MEAGDYIRIEGYEVIDELGVGGMGTVYRARQIGFDREVALKVIHRHFASRSEFQSRFRDEMRTAIGLEHPNVVPVYEIGEGETLFISMLLVPGRDLATRVKDDGPLDIEEAVTIVRQVASALDEAHRNNIVHRDVKPQNVIVDERITHAYLTDFGLARSLDATSGLTATGNRIGTIDYMAPEQIEDGTVDHRSDEYALACLFYAIVTGRRPFAGDSDAAVIRAKMRGPSSPRLDDEDGFPTVIADVIEKAQSERPEDRFDSAGAFATALEMALKGEALPTRRLPRGPSQERTEPMPRPVPRRQNPQLEPAPTGSGSSSRSALIGIGVAALVALAVGTAFMVGSSSNDPSPGLAAATTTTTTTTTTSSSTTTSTVDPPHRLPPRSVKLQDFSGDRYTAQVPAGWTPELINEKNGKRTTSQWRDPADDNTSVLIDNQPVDPSLTAPEAAASVRAQTSQTPGYSEISYGETTVAGVPAIKWVFDLKDEGDRRVDYFFTNCGVGFAVLGSTSPERFARMEPTFSKVANSVYPYCE